MLRLSRERKPMSLKVRENQMPLPPLLLDLMASKRWRQPSDAAIFAAIPFLREPVDFLLTDAHMRFESQGQCVGLTHMREFRGSESGDRPLPWIDADLSLFTAVNRESGADFGIALDFRTSYDDPRVVASDWWTDDHTLYWREAFSTFSSFVAAIRL